MKNMYVDVLYIYSKQQMQIVYKKVKDRGRCSRCTNKENKKNISIEARKQDDSSPIKKGRAFGGRVKTSAESSEEEETGPCFNYLTLWPTENQGDKKGSVHSTGVFVEFTR